MKRYLLTGTPGAGKTAILRWLECEGFPVVEEAATDVIALRQAQGEPEPWADPSFVDAVVALQRLRQEGAAGPPGEVRFFDRSPVCTYALAVYLGHPVSRALARELDRIRAEGVYERRVFFVESPGFVTPTEARRISYEESLRFERIHREAYARFGYECLPIAPGPLADRAAAVVRHVGGPTRHGRRGG
ncbi:AAA family ATPase [Streptomyces sp. CBMA156]|uniref:AAA family ATPase n=1 Tax=Streptomyces sp. CBMA156 TaxID=1930280 RepID=UPI001661B628|nr:AAA family ATPase [Streptomyces sp. CBMA156]MBD0672518.1 ATPase [Streptomyces sp. CBMA156]